MSNVSCAGRYPAPTAATPQRGVHIARLMPAREIPPGSHILGAASFSCCSPLTCFHALPGRLLPNPFTSARIANRMKVGFTAQRLVSGGSAFSFGPLISYSGLACRVWRDKWLGHRSEAQVHGVSLIDRTSPSTIDHHSHVGNEEYSCVVTRGLSVQARPNDPLIHAIPSYCQQGAVVSARRYI